MGQPVTVVEKPSARAGVVRYETNRVLSGTGHEYYRSLDDAQGNSPSDDVARRLFELGGIDAVHVNANVITVHFSNGVATDGVKEIIEDLHTYYRPGVEVAMPEGAAAE